jgi:hypothetical protein
MVAAAIVIGSRITAKFAGETTRSSSVPAQRSRWSAELAGTLVAVQIPITAAASPTGPRLDEPRPVRNMKNATVAKNSGQSTASRPSKADRDIILMCRSHRKPSRRRLRLISRL